MVTTTIRIPLKALNGGPYGAGQLKIEASGDEVELEASEGSDRMTVDRRRFEAAARLILASGGLDGED